LRRVFRSKIPEVTQDVITLFNEEHSKMHAKEDKAYKISVRKLLGRGLL
jgi:hypothetical protein